MVLITGGAYSGLRSFAEQQFGNKIETVYIRDILAENYDEEESIVPCLQKWLEEKEAKYSELLLIHEEVGCGLIPDTKEKRQEREAQGRAGCFFAENAKEVYRVCCGLGIKIK